MEMPGTIGVLLVMTFALIFPFLWIYALVNIIKYDYEGDNTKLLWVVLLILMAPLGTILYYTISPKKKVKGIEAMKVCKHQTPKGTEYFYHE